MIDLTASVVSAESEGLTSRLERMSEQSAISRITPIVKKSSKLGCKRAGSMMPLSGLIYVPSMAKSGLGEWILSMGDSHAKTSASQGKGLESRREQGVGYGSSYIDLFVRYDPVTSSWRMCQQSLAGDSIPFSDAFMKQGMMLNGRLLKPRMLGHHIGGNDGSASPRWLTPSTIQIEPKEGRYEKRKAYRESIGRHWVPGCLEEQIKMYPTPNAQPPGWKVENVVDKEGNIPSHPHQRLYDKKTGIHRNQGLEQAIKLYPTPQIRDWKGKSQRANFQEENRDCLPNVVCRTYPTPKAQNANSLCIHGQGGQELQTVVSGEQTQQTSTLRLNPHWVTWLMGFPPFWTDLRQNLTATHHESQATDMKEPTNSNVLETQSYPNKGA